VPVADGQTDSERDTRAFNDDMTFRAGFDAADLSWVALLIPHVRIVEQRLQPVEYVRSMRIGRQYLVQALPNSRLAPLGQSPEAGHSTADILLLWHEPPTVPSSTVQTGRSAPSVGRVTISIPACGTTARAGRQRPQNYP